MCGKVVEYIDIGGNVGYFAVMAAAHGYRVHVFEGMPPNVGLLEMSKCLNGFSNVHIYPYMLSSKSQRCALISPFDNVGDITVECYNRTVIDHPTGDLGNNFTRRGFLETVPFDSIAMTWEAGPTYVMKIDVERHEILVMEGGAQFLSSPNKPVVIVSEVWQAFDIPKYGRIMMGHGYHGYNVKSKQEMTEESHFAEFQKSMPIIIDTIVFFLPAHKNLVTV